MGIGVYLDDPVKLIVPGNVLVPRVGRTRIPGDGFSVFIQQLIRLPRLLIGPGKGGQQRAQ